jgi:hypothetical protein
VAKRGNVGTLWIVWAAVAVLLLVLALRAEHTIYRVMFGPIAFRYWVSVGGPVLALWSLLREFGVA